MKSKSKIIQIIIPTLICLTFPLDYIPTASAQGSNKPEFGIPAQTMPYPEYEQHGQLVSLKIIPAKKETRLYIVGNEAARVNVDKYAVHAKVMMGRHQKEIDFMRENDYFKTNEKLKGEWIHLKLEDTETKKSETFKIKLKNP